MQEMQRFVIPARDVRSLCWEGDELVDWVAGENRYRLDGTTIPRYVNYAYRFDLAVVSPDRQYAAIYERLGTKGLILHHGDIVREINRSYYHADVYEYPLVLFTLPDGRTGLAHCPDDYNRIEIEVAETGERLTSRAGEGMDFFHSRFQVTPDGRHLLSAGWVWHPFDEVLLFDIPEALAHPANLDEVEYGWLGRTGVEINVAAFADDERIVVAGSDTFYQEEEGGEGIRPGEIGVYNFATRRFESISRLEQAAGTLMPVGDHAIGFFEQPKLIHLATGEVVARWPELHTGKQNSSIVPDIEKPPPLALDSLNRRFAVADEEAITIIQLG